MAGEARRQFAVGDRVRFRPPSTTNRWSQSTPVTGMISYADYGRAPDGADEDYFDLDVGDGRVLKDVESKYLSMRGVRQNAGRRDVLRSE